MPPRARDTQRNRSPAVLSQARYLSLETRRRSGAVVATPVWFAEHGAHYYVFSAGAAGKVKRLRHTRDVRVCPCDARGQLTGDWVDTVATLVDASVPENTAEVAAAYAALRRRYGWQMRLLDGLSFLSGRIKTRQLIRVAIPADAA